jgi:hypothetical protein
MVKSAAATPEAYLEDLPQDRRDIISPLRQLVLENLPPGYVETMRWGGLSYEVPLERYPDTYNKQPLMYAALAAQKNYCSLYLTAPYQDPAAAERLREEFQKAGKKLNMGKSCLRFKRLEDLPLEVIARNIAGTAVDQFIAAYEKSRHGSRQQGRRSSAAAGK